MKILGYGGINTDFVYHVDRFVSEGESMPCKSLESILGGKGCNQSIAVALAGQKEVYHAGQIGNGEKWLLDVFNDYGVNTSQVKVTDGASGHAIIQMRSDGKNSIILFGGANHTITEDDVVEAFEGFGEGDFLLTQNELSSQGKIIEEASKRGMKIFINVSPIEEKTHDLPLELLDYVIVNEIEAELLTGKPYGPNSLKDMREKMPKAVLIITLGPKGAIYMGADDKEIAVPTPDAPVLATTSAGDTFAGYFTAAIAEGDPLQKAVELACKASALCVSRKGTTNSIPNRADVDAWEPVGFAS